MTRELAKSTLERLRRKLEVEEERLVDIIAEYDKVFTEANLGSTSTAPIPTAPMVDRWHSNSRWIYRFSRMPRNS